MVHIYNTQFRIMPDRASKKRLAQLVEKGPVVDTGTQRGAAKYASEIVARTGNSYNMIGALGDHVSFRIPIEAYADGVDPTVYPKYGGEIITPKPDSRTIFMEYEDETWRLPKPTTIAPNRR